MTLLAGVQSLATPAADVRSVAGPTEGGISTVAAEESVAEEEGTPVSGSVEAVGWPDESAEAAFWAEARERGEVRPGREESEAEPAAETTTALPPLDGLVDRVPAEVKAALDELFRARFVRVTRVPRRALKTTGRS